MEVSYNSRTYRWEVRRKATALPEGTHPSRDQAILLAMNLLEQNRRGEVRLFNEDGTPEKVIYIEVEQMQTERSAARATKSVVSELTGDQQPRSKSEPARSRLRS